MNLHHFPPCDGPSRTASYPYADGDELSTPSYTDFNISSDSSLAFALGRNMYACNLSTKAKVPLALVSSPLDNQAIISYGINGSTNSSVFSLQNDNECRGAIKRPSVPSLATVTSDPLRFDTIPSSLVGHGPCFATTHPLPTSINLDSGARGTVSSPYVRLPLTLSIISRDTCDIPESLPATAVNQRNSSGSSGTVSASYNQTQQKQASPIPPGTKQSSITKKEPILACFYCRGRKISCKPQAHSSSGRTCQ
ncbi:hypothetical protein QCA50_014073 [Cerrena zonata]|uniref:Zn(2)-C6 fungal-type domain-containing protein n=1 Tax=Cerrena zonata TaxID=2478898 RepID=A0AAW0G0X8_9APHY